MEEKVYIVQEEWNVDGSTDFEVLSVHDNEEDAKKALEKEKDIIKYQYIGNEDFEVERDEPKLFEFQRNEWDKYYIVKIIEKNMKKTH